MPEERTKHPPRPNRTLWFFTAALLIINTGCATIPTLTPMATAPDSAPSSADAKQRAACQAIYPRQPVSLAHAIDISAGLGRRGAMMGAAAIHPSENRLEAAILTIEGLVLFSGRHANGQAQTDRALPPFDDPDFADNMLSDIRLMFFPPEGAPISGNLPDGRTACRYEAGEQVVDIVPNNANASASPNANVGSNASADPDANAGPNANAGAAGGWTLTAYQNGRLRRTIRATTKGAPFPAETMTLTAHGRPAYRLGMTLISADPIPEKAAPPD